MSRFFYSGTRCLEKGEIFFSNSADFRTSVQKALTSYTSSLTSSDDLADEALTSSTRSLTSPDDSTSATPEKPCLPEPGHHALLDRPDALDAILDELKKSPSI